MYQRLLKNSIYSGFGRFGTMIVSIVLTPIIISHLGDNYFAIWSLVTLVISYIGFLDFGVSGAYSKYIAEFHAKNDLDKINGVIISGIGLYLLISVFVIATGLPLIQLTPRIFNIAKELQPEALTSFRIGLFVFAFASTFNVLEAIPVGLQRMEYNNSIQVFTSILYCIASIIYLNANGGIIGLMFIRAADSALQIILLFICARKILPTFRISPKYLDLKLAKELVGFGLKVQAGKLANIGIANINKILIGTFAGLTGVANYQIGSTIVQGVRDISMITFSGMTPMASQIHAQNRRDDLLNLYHNGVRVSFVVTSAAFGLICAVADPIIVLWTGKHYPIAVIVLISLALANFIHVSTGTGTCLTRGIGRPGLETVFGVTLLSSNLVLGWIFGRIWGIQGVLAGTVIAYFSSSLFFMFWFNRVIGFSNPQYFRKVILPPTLALLSSLFTGWIVRQLLPSIALSADIVNRFDALGNIIINGSIFAIVYLAVLVMSGYIRLHHFKVVINFLANLPMFRSFMLYWSKKS